LTPFDLLAFGETDSIYGTCHPSCNLNALEGFNSPRGGHDVRNRFGFDRHNIYGESERSSPSALGLGAGGGGVGLGAF
jgi:hypothetical protein